MKWPPDDNAIRPDAQCIVSSSEYPPTTRQPLKRCIDGTRHTRWEASSNSIHRRKGQTRRQEVRDKQSNCTDDDSQQCHSVYPDTMDQRPSIATSGIYQQGPGGGNGRYGEYEAIGSSPTKCPVFWLCGHIGIVECAQRSWVWHFETLASFAQRGLLQIRRPTTYRLAKMVGFVPCGH